MDKYNIYDSIVQSTIINLESFSKNNKIIIKNFEDDEYNNYLIHVANILSIFNSDKKVYIECSFFQYLKIKFRYKKERVKIKRYTYTTIDADDDPIEPAKLLLFTAEDFSQPVTIIKDIYNEYYKKEK